MAAEDHQQSESPRQGELRSEDLGSASPVVEAEEGESPGIPDPSGYCQEPGGPPKQNSWRLPFEIQISQQVHRSFRVLPK